MNLQELFQSMARTANRSLIGVLACLLVLTTNAAAVGQDIEATSPTLASDLPQPGNRMGTCYANYETEDEAVTPLAPLAYAAGSRWDRVDFSWERIEIEHDDDWHFDAYDSLVEHQTSYGLDIVGILAFTPYWAATSCQTASQTRELPPELQGHPSLLGAQGALPAQTMVSYRTCPPKNLYLPWNHPDNHWGDFVFTTVDRYRDAVDVWEIWNEPDLYNEFWAGSPADYAQLLKIGYEAAKAADPSVTVLFSGLAYWADPTYYIQVLDTLKNLPGAPDHNYYFDVMSLHLYSNIYTIRPVAASIFANMESRVGSHPIWLTETGVPLWDEYPGQTPPSTLNHATAEETAAYSVEAFAEARSIGIDKFIFFRTHDEAMQEYFGLIRNDGSTRPAYNAFHVAASYLHGENQITGPFTSGAGVRRVTFWGTPEGRVDVLWNTTGAPVSIEHPAILPTATLVNHRGELTTLTAQSGAFPLTLGPATANNTIDGSYMIGGPPLLVVQRDVTPPTSELQDLPPVWYTRALTLTLDVADEGAGYWYAEIERADTPSGPWTQIAGWTETAGTTTAVVPTPGSGTHYFRARVRDRAGNWEEWPASAETSTTAILTRTVGLTVSVYYDENSSGVQDEGEGPSNAALTWQHTETGVISQTVGASWIITETVDIGDHLVTARASDYLPAFHAFTVPGGPEPIYYSLSLGLKPIRARVYLPMIARSP